MTHDRKGSQDENQLKGEYANYFKIGQNAFEFLLDFGQYYPEVGKEHFHTRVICNPYYANELLRTLQMSIDQYKKSFGSIPEEQGV